MFNHLMKILKKSCLELAYPKSMVGCMVHDRKYSASTSEQKRNINILNENKKVKIYNYDEIKQIINNPNENKKIFLIDVREPSEYKKGFIPTSINIPYNTSPEALQLSPKNFKSFFGFEKPKLDDELIFYCFLGIRSSAAEQLASTFGYKKRGNYIGSYNEWVNCSKKQHEKL